MSQHDPASYAWRLQQDYAAVRARLVCGRPGPEPSENRRPGPEPSENRRPGPEPEQKPPPRPAPQPAPARQRDSVDLPTAPDIAVSGNSVPDIVTPLPHPSIWRAIVSEVCAKHRVGWLDMASTRRAPHLVAARHEAWYRLRFETTLSLPQIARKFGRDHTSILHGIRRHEGGLTGVPHVRRRSPGRVAS